MSGGWERDYRLTRSWDRDFHSSSDREGFDREIDEDGINLEVPTRVYSDFFVPANSADMLGEELERIGYEIFFIGADADPTVVYSRCEQLWTREMLYSLTDQLLAVCDRYEAGYDGSLLTSLEHDDMP